MWGRVILGGVLVALLVGCSVFEGRINEPADPTASPRPFRTATPGGQISVWMDPVPGESPTPGTQVESPPPAGQLVGPAATGTAAVVRIQNATATASAPTPQPAFQPDDCPTIRGVAPPAPPATFREYPAALGVYLSNGGAPAVLESSLRDWGAITGQGGVVQADTDLTGDKIPEIIINLFDPTRYNPDAVLNSGQMLIYGCDNGGYRLLYSTPANPGVALPVLHRVGDMNADTVAEVVYDTQSCSATTCNREGIILTWRPVVGIFEPLNSGQILAINGRLGIVDIDSDGVLEITVTSSAPSSPAAGPTRTILDIWDWTGQNYVLAVRTPDDPVYRVHQLHDADAELTAGNTREALRAYNAVRNETDLQAWTLPNETAQLRAFAAFRIMTIYANIGDPRVDNLWETLASENPEGTPGSAFAAWGAAFIETFRATESPSAGCQAVRSLVTSTRPEALAFLNSYGFANRNYTATDICPF